VAVDAGCLWPPFAAKASDVLSASNAKEIEKMSARIANRFPNNVSFLCGPFI